MDAARFPLFFGLLVPVLVASGALAQDAPAEDAREGAFDPQGNAGVNDSQEPEEVTGLAAGTTTLIVLVVLAVLVIALVVAIASQGP